MSTTRRELKHAVEALRRIPFFSDCTFAELAQIDRLGTVLDVPSGRSLTREGDEGHECFVTVEGVATAERSGRIIGAIGTASIAGEMALLDHTRRNATVVTSTAMRLIVFSDREFMQMLRIAPRIEASLARIAEERRSPAGVSA